MRKISIVLAVALLLTLCVPFGVAAAEVDNAAPDTHEEMVDLACKVFPEYADNIATPRAPIRQSRSASDPVVVSEARQISDQEVMTYTEHASGKAFLTFTKTWDETASSTSGNTKTVTGTVTVTCNTSMQVFYIGDMKYKIDYNGYDAIVDRGSRRNTTCHSVTETQLKDKEDSSGSARHQYEALFYPPDHSALVPAVCRIVITVGNDQFNLSAQG